MNEKRKYQQLWLRKYSDSSRTNVTVQKHIHVWHYLSISADVEIEFTYEHNKENSSFNNKNLSVSWPSSSPSGHNRTPAAKKQPVVSTPTTLNHPMKHLSLPINCLSPLCL
eukprot:14383178-Ditylum_brightwellii.AAC.1